MQPVEIDVIRPQSFQAGLDRLHHVLALVATRVGVSARLTAEADNGICIFGRKHDLLAMPGDELAHELLAGAIGINVRRVDEIAARFAKGIVNLARFILRTTPAPILAKGHRAETEIGDAQSAAAEELVIHCFHVATVTRAAGNRKSIPPSGSHPLGPVGSIAERVAKKARYLRRSISHLQT